MKQVWHTLRALPTLLRVGFADALAYRAEFLVWVLAYTMPIIMMALWSEVAREAPVGRFGERDFQAYFLGTLLIRLVTGAWVIWEMNMEIRQGTLQKRLLRPIHPLLTYLIENIAALPMRFMIAAPIAIASVLWLGGSVITDDALQQLLIPVSILGAFLLNFLAMATIGTLALYWESSTGVFDLWLGLYTVFSGYLMPLELFPGWLRVWVERLPFRAMLAYPVENMLGTLPRSESVRELMLQWAWVLALAVVTNLTWRGGIKRYAAYGG